MPQNYNMIPGNISMGANTIIKRKPDDTGWYAPVLNKELIGLGEVDNTSDADKPVSDATLAALDEKADIDSLSLVATSGNYSDLSGTPELSDVALSGDYSDLTNKPTIPTVRREEVYSGTTGSDGRYTVVYSTPYSQTPFVQPMVNVDSSYRLLTRVVSSDANGFTVEVAQRNASLLTLLGLDVLTAGVTVQSNVSVMVKVTAQ